MTLQSLKPLVKWQDIEQKLDGLCPVEGGFSQAKRGLVNLDDGTCVFVKIGLEDDTRRWTKKEIGSYRFLQKYNYPYIPQLLAVNSDESGFVIDAYTPKNGWDWKDNWDKERLDKTLEAMDALAVIKPQDQDFAYFAEKVFDESEDGWKPLLESPESQQKLHEKLCAIGRSDIANRIDFMADAEKSQRFIFKNDILVHNDVRADNCAWNPMTKEVRLVDWNWVQLGDRKIDLAALLTHVQKSGFDILPQYIDRLDADALHWLAGFWFKSAITPIWPGGPEHLRHVQLISGVAALDLMDRVLL